MIFCVAFIGINTVKASECLSLDGMTPKEQQLIGSVMEYTYTDLEGYVKFDLSSAEKADLSEEAIAIGEEINQISNAVKSEFGNSEGVSYRVAASNLILYGNYCGKGNRGWSVPPVDSIDAACREHDKCYVHGGNNTECNRSFCQKLRVLLRNYEEGTTKFRFIAAAMTVFCWGV